MESLVGVWAFFDATGRDRLLGLLGIAALTLIVVGLRAGQSSPRLRSALVAVGAIPLAVLIWWWFFIPPALALLMVVFWVMTRRQQVALR